MTPIAPAVPVVTDELDVLADLVPLAGQRLVELGCGPAQLARALLKRHPGTEITAIEVDQRQLAKNLAQPQSGLHFEHGVAQRIAHPDGRFDGALMLKSLHHVPVVDMAAALAEVARVLKPSGWLYVSEPVYAGPLNELVRLYNDEGPVRAAAQAALDQALRGGAWEQVAERRFETPAHFRDFDEFEQRMMRPTFTDHHLTEALIEAVRVRYAPHQGPQGADFTRPMHVRLLRRRG